MDFWYNFIPPKLAKNRQNCNNILYKGYYGSTGENIFNFEKLCSCILLWRGNKKLIIEL